MADENSAAFASSKGGSEVITEARESVLQLLERHVEGGDRVETAVGFVGEDVGAFNGFEGDGVVEILLASGPSTDLVEGLFEVHHVIDVGHFLVLSEEFGVDGLAVGGGQTKIEEHAGFLWLVEHSHVLRAEAHRSDGGPLGVVPTSTQHSEGVEFEN